MACPLYISLIATCHGSMVTASHLGSPSLVSYAVWVSFVILPQSGRHCVALRIRYLITALFYFSKHFMMQIESSIYALFSECSNSGIVYPSYAPSIPVVPTNPGYPYVIGSNCVPVQLQQQVQ